MEELKRLNKLSSQHIFAGQVCSFSLCGYVSGCVPENLSVILSLDSMSSLAVLFPSVFLSCTSDPDFPGSGTFQITILRITSLPRSLRVDLSLFYSVI